jgi:hypothetical protein
MKHYIIPPKMNDWFELIPTENFGGSTERLRFKDTRTGAEISTYYDTENALGFYDIDEAGRAIPYFEAYPICGDIKRCETSEELFHIVLSEFDRIWRGDKPQPTEEALIMALQNLYDDYAGYYPSAVNNSPAMKAALDILQTVGELPETNQPSYNPMNRSGNL